MKIAFDHQIFCLQKKGGVSRYFCCLAEEYLKRAHDVSAFAPLHVNDLLDSCAALTKHGRKVESYLPKLGGLTVKYNQWKGTRNIRRWQPDVVHKTFYSSKNRQSFCAPVVVTVHDMIHELFPDEFRTKDNTQKLKHDAVLAADRVICISENTKKDLLQFVNVDESKVSVIYHGLGLPNRLNSYTDKPDTPSLGKPIVLYVGARNRYKNFDTVIKALGINKTLREDVELVAFGGGPFTESELVLLKKCNIENYRQESGDDDKLTRYYNQAAVFVYPSIYEGFGFPPLEAMASGCPVVASNASAIPEILGNACLYFEPKDEEALATQILRVLTDKTLGSCLTEAGYSQSTKYSWEKTAEETLNVYASLA